MSMENATNETQNTTTLVVRNPCFGLPTGCPVCLPVYLSLRFAQVPFNLDCNSIFPDSDQIPYVEYGDCVVYNNEKGGVLEGLKEEGIVDLDRGVGSDPEWLATKALVSSWLEDAVAYELWVGSDGSSANNIYFSHLPWPVGKILFIKQVRAVKQQLGITKDNAEQKEEEIYRKASTAYGALSLKLGEQKFLYEDRLSSLDAIFLGHALFTLQALPETSVLRSKFLEHSNLVRYAENLKMEFVESASSNSAVPQFSSDPSSSVPKTGPSNWRSKSKPKPKKERTEEEKTFRKRSKYFLVAQLVAVVVFLSLMSGVDDSELELEDDGEGYDYNE